MHILCLDLEGVLVPEIWIGVAQRTGIDALRATTRDIPDYDELMQQRLRILDEHDIRLNVIQDVIAAMGPLDGAKDFLDWARARFQVFIVSDTFYEFGMPLMEQLGMPTLLCHRLSIDENGRIADYHLRQADPKRKTIQALHSLHYRIIAAGDSYNDVTMLSEADAGILFRAPDNVIAEFPQYPATEAYAELRQAILEAESAL